MPDKRLFKIGQLVEVNLNHEAKADYTEDSYRKVKRVIDWKGFKVHTNDLILAKITGTKQFWEGKYQAACQPGRSYSSHEAEYEQAYTSQDKQVIVWCVRLGYRNKELYFFTEDIKKLDFIGMGLDIPYLWNGWTDHYKQKLSREAKDWPRDSKGRFCKGLLGSYTSTQSITTER